jgi:hypothetical protein
VLAKIIDEPAGSSELTLSGLAEMATQLNSDDPMVRREVADVFKSVLSKGRALAHLATRRGSRAKLSLSSPPRILCCDTGTARGRAGGGVQADEIIALGVLPRFVEFLQCHDDPILQVQTHSLHFQSHLHAVAQLPHRPLLVCSYRLKPR